MGARKLSANRARPGQGRDQSAQARRILQAASEFDWNSAFEREDDRFDYGEDCFVANGQIGYELYVMVFAEGSHENAVRVISLPLAEKHEARFYYGQV